MRCLKLAIFALLLSCWLYVPLHAQKSTSCKAPDADPGQTKEQQEAAADGYLVGCKSATAPDSHALQTESESDSGYSVDSIIPALPVDQSKWDADDYFTWLDTKGCSHLLQMVQTRIARRSAREKKVYLAAVLQGINGNNGQCD